MAFENRYSPIDRLLHRAAFSTAPVQIGLADLEDRLFRGQIARGTVHKPVFIAGLPRAGTTLLLDLLAGLEEFETHRYRNMPFVLLPLIWDRFARKFQQGDTPRERAHADGMLVSVDSPEAFEEMLWKAMWPEHYPPDRIVPWDRAEHPEFLQFFTNHMKKITSLTPAANATPRYISKNNLNIARLPWLTGAFPDAVIIVPFRDPLQQAASLLRQHLNFLQIHASDGFARTYMAGIGHFDFGANLRPVDFSGWLASPHHHDPQTIGFWLEYWAAAYGHLRQQAAGGLHFLSFEALCGEPRRGLTQLADVAAVADRQGLLAMAETIRMGTTHESDISGVDPAVLSRTHEIWSELKDRSLA